MRALLACSICCAACAAEPKSVGLEPDTECADIDDAATCGAASNCAWVEISTIQGGNDYCFYEEPRHACIATANHEEDEACLPEPACGGTEPEPAYYLPRPDLGPEAYDIISDYAGGCVAYPVGFDVCYADGLQPWACECICGPNGSPGLPPHIGQVLDLQSGCADVFLYAYTEIGSLALTVSVAAGYAMQATDTMMPVDVELFAGTDVEVRLYDGDDLDAQFCTDVGGLGRIDSSWTAIGGTVALHIEPVDGQPHASATLTNLSFQPDDASGTAYNIDSYVFTDVLVGWLPG